MRAYGAFSYPVLGDRSARSGVWEGPSVAAANNPWPTDAHVLAAERAAARQERAAQLAGPAGGEVALSGAEVTVVSGDGAIIVGEEGASTNGTARPYAHPEAAHPYAYDVRTGEVYGAPGQAVELHPLALGKR